MGFALKKRWWALPNSENHVEEMRFLLIRKDHREVAQKVGGVEIKKGQKAPFSTIRCVS